MLLKDNEIVFHDYEWITNGDSKVPNSNVKLVSPFFNLVEGDVEYRKTFRFAIRVQGSKFFDKFQTIVYLYVNNVQQFGGIEVKAVECIVHGETINLETKFDESVMKVFKSNEFLTYDHLSNKGISLKYRIYIGPIKANYKRSYGFELRDTQFGEEMWSAAQEGYMTDCEFVIQREVFSAHLAIVSARCPQLAERISRENNKQVVINDDTSPAIFKAVLYFLYTGNITSMDETSQRRFTALATTFNIKTIMQIRQFIKSPDRQFSEITEFFLDIQPALRNNSCTIEIRENYGVVSLVRRGLRLRYDFVRTVKPEETVPPEVFRFDKEGFFGVTLTVPQKNGRTSYQLTFSSFNLLSGFEVASVSFSKDNGPNIPMVKVYEEDGDTCKIFVDGLSLSRQSDYALNIINLNFTVHLFETNECWGYRLHDPLLPVHYWTSTKNPELTDVELRVGNRSFQAHRAILSARSSVFNAMFSHDTSESQTGLVNITDLNPEVFQDFLVFLYTGRLSTSENMADLWVAADKYDVKTLERITEIARVRPRIEDLTVSLLSKL